TGPRPLWTVREYDPVAPGALGLVQRLVGPLEQRLETLVRTAQGHAQAHRDRHWHAVLERMPLDRPAQVLGDPGDLVGTHARQQDHELLAAPAHQPVAGAQLAPQYRGQFVQHAVAGVVAAA